MTRKVGGYTKSSDGNFLKKAYERDQIRHQHLLWLYLEMGSLIEDCTLLIGRRTTFLDHFILDCYRRVAANILRNNAIFEKDATLRKRGFPGTRMHEPHRLAMLTLGIEFVYGQATQRGFRARNFDTLRKGLPFVPAVYNILIESFQRATNGYKEWHDRSLALRLKMANGTITTLELADLSNLESRMVETETRVGGERATLYGIIHQVDSKMVVVIDYQKHISKAYERLVLQIAKKFGRSAMQIEDNFQQGAFGLQRAIRYFDPSRGKAFSGIARWWIQAAILLTIKKEANLVPVPASVWKQHETYERYANAHGIMGDIAGLAKAFEHEYSEVEAVYAAVNINRPRSFEDPVSAGVEDDNGRLGDKIQDPTPNVEENLLAVDTSVPQFLELLSPTERLIVCCAYGLFEHIPQPQACDELSRSKERLRQIAVSATADYKSGAF